jgi:hypothetical protein
MTNYFIYWYFVRNVALMNNLFADIAFHDGKVGNYLFIGNMVYTVSNNYIVCIMNLRPKTGR